MPLTAAHHLWTKLRSRWRGCCCQSCAPLTTAPDLKTQTCTRKWTSRRSTSSLDPPSSIWVGVHLPRHPQVLHEPLQQLRTEQTDFPARSRASWQTVASRAAVVDVFIYYLLGIVFEMTNREQHLHSTWLSERSPTFIWRCYYGNDSWMGAGSVCVYMCLCVCVLRWCVTCSVTINVYREGKARFFGNKYLMKLPPSYSYF